MPRVKHRDRLGRISELLKQTLKQTRFDSRADLETTLLNYLKLYNHIFLSAPSAPKRQSKRSKNGSNASRSYSSTAFTIKWDSTRGQCRALADHGSRLPGQAARGAALSATPTLAWLWEQPGSLATLRELQRDNCHFDAWLRFARVPWLGATAATDARYGAPGETNFSTMRFAELAAKPCSAHVPGWGRPREDLLHIPAQGQARR